MMLKLRAAWARLLETLWFVPSAVGLAGAALAIAMVEVSARVDAEILARFPRVFGASADSSRSLLAAIAGSIITVAGVTFSLTMGAVAQASGQYTSRILRTYMRDRPTQIVLGLFVGIFAYCLLVVRSIRSVEESRFVPSLAVVLGIVLAFVGMGALIFFIHHIASTLQVSHLLERIGRETITAVDRLFPHDVAHEASPAEETAALARLRGMQWQTVLAKRTGYLQTIDADRLVRIAKDHDAVIRLEVRIGEFLIEGTAIASMASEFDSRVGRHGPGPESLPERASNRKEPDESIVSCFGVGTFRTIGEDAGFGVRQIVDVALKALSPGVNDTTTAVTCVDWLGAVLVRLANRRVETPFRSAGGVVRVIATGPTFASMLALSVDEIRQNAAGNVTVLGALLHMLTRVARVSRDAGRRTLLAEHVTLVREHIERRVEARHDRERLYRLVAVALAADDLPYEALTAHE